MNTAQFKTMHQQEMLSFFRSFGSNIRFNYSLVHNKQGNGQKDDSATVTLACRMLGTTKRDKFSNAWITQ